ncbi:hypothetical protein KFS98_003527 [Salmonella enterica]|nr:hypothetical protein [Salmonella enterica]
MILAYLKSKKEAVRLQTVIEEDSNRIKVLVSGAMLGEIIITENGAITRAHSDVAPQRLLILELAPIIRSNLHYLVGGDHFISIVNDDLTVWRSNPDSNEVSHRVRINLISNNSVDCDMSDDLSNLAIMIAIS